MSLKKIAKIVGAIGLAPLTGGASLGVLIPTGGDGSSGGGSVAQTTATTASQNVGQSVNVIFGSTPETAEQLSALRSEQEERIRESTEMTLGAIRDIAIQQTGIGSALLAQSTTGVQTLQATFQEKSKKEEERAGATTQKISTLSAVAGAVVIFLVILLFRK